MQEWGVMNKVANDHAQIKFLNTVLSFLCDHDINSWKNESYYKHQKPNEQKYSNLQHFCVIPRKGYTTM